MKILIAILISIMAVGSGVLFAKYNLEKSKIAATNMAPINSDTLPTQNAVNPTPKSNTQMDNSLDTSFVFSIKGNIKMELYNEQKKLLTEGDAESLTDDIDQKTQSPVSTVLYYMKPQTATYYLLVSDPKSPIADNLELIFDNGVQESNKIIISVKLSAREKGIYKILFDQLDLKKIIVKQIESF